MSEEDYYQVANRKLTNRQNVYHNKESISQKENKITNDLLYYYDKNFNNYYDTNSELDQNIETNERIISINNDDFYQKSNKILILKNILFLTIFGILVAIGHMFLKLYEKTTMTILIVLGCLYYVFSIIYQIYYNKFTRGKYLSNQFANNSSSSFFKEAARDILPNYMTRDKCPKGCRKKHHPPTRCPKNMENCQEVTPHRIKEMRTDSTLNNWEKGDILYMECTVINPADLTDKERENVIRKGLDLNRRLMKCPLKNGGSVIMNEPEPAYSGIKDNIHSNTIYTCEWENVGEPIGDQGYEFSGKIPCKYYVGYRTKEVRVGGDKL